MDNKDQVVSTGTEPEVKDVDKVENQKVSETNVVQSADERVVFVRQPPGGYSSLKLF